MFERIRRTVSKPATAGRWDPDQALEPEVEADQEPRVENTVPASPPTETHKFDSSGVEYQRTLVQTAIDQGGKLYNHEMSLPWLRTILAGLEGREVRPEDAWDAESIDMPESPVPPTYYKLFPAEREPEPGHFR
ncbi:MAG: hypothetical protein HY247_05595 [archaeon]|nr:MAG: hypothetical protein HY247_05595 [archaeon]